MNLLGTEKVPESPDRAGEGASCIAGGRAGDGGIKRRYPKIAAGGGMIGLGKGIGIVPSAVPAGAAARGKRAGGPGTLSAGQAWKMAARWHELVRTQERAHSTMVRLINYLERG